MGCNNALVQESLENNVKFDAVGFISGYIIKQPVTRGDVLFD